jgi:hypothetical protein
MKGVGSAHAVTCALQLYQLTVERCLIVPRSAVAPIANTGETSTPPACSASIRACSFRFWIFFYVLRILFLQFLLGVFSSSFWVCSQFFLAFGCVLHSLLPFAFAVDIRRERNKPTPSAVSKPGRGDAPGFCAPGEAMHPPTTPARSC